MDYKKLAEETAHLSLTDQQAWDYVFHSNPTVQTAFLGVTPEDQNLVKQQFIDHRKEIHLNQNPPQPPNV